MSFAVLLCLFAVFGASQCDKNLKITVFEECLCPDCKDFMLNQLVPMLGEFGRYPDWITLDIVPFGFAQRDGKGGYTCQHGVKECEGNKIEACVIDQLVTKRGDKPLFIRLANFLYCAESTSDLVKSAKQCSKKSGVNYKQLMKCYNGKLGEKLIDGYANRTLNFTPALTWVPTIVINDVFNQTESDWAQKDLYGLVCSYYPDECT